MYYALKYYVSALEPKQRTGQIFFFFVFLNQIWIYYSLRKFILNVLFGEI